MPAKRTTLFTVALAVGAFSGCGPDSLVTGTIPVGQWPSIVEASRASVVLDPGDTAWVSVSVADEESAQLPIVTLSWASTNVDAFTVLDHDDDYTTIVRGEGPGFGDLIVTATANDSTLQGSIPVTVRDTTTPPPPGPYNEPGGMSEFWHFEGSAAVIPRPGNRMGWDDNIFDFQRWDTAAYVAEPTITSPIGADSVLVLYHNSQGPGQDEIGSIAKSFGEDADAVYVRMWMNHHFGTSRDASCHGNKMFFIHHQTGAAWFFPTIEGNRDFVLNFQGPTDPDYYDATNALDSFGDEWVLFEFLLEAETGSNDGRLQSWINGVNVFEQNELDTGTSGTGYLSDGFQLYYTPPSNDYDCGPHDVEIAEIYVSYSGN